MFRIVVAIIISSCLLACGVDQTDPQAVAEEYVEAVYFANLPRFKQLVEEKNHQATADYQRFTENNSTAKSNTRKFRGDISLIAATEHSVNGNRARVRVKVEFNNGERRLISVPLHKVEQHWFVGPMSWARW